MRDGQRSMVKRCSAVLLVMFLIAVGFAGSMLLDAPMREALRHRPRRSHEWQEMLNMAGYLPVWLIVGAALILHDWPTRAAVGLRRAVGRGLLVVLGPMLSGGVSEVVKMLVRRARPPRVWLDWDGCYTFRPFSEDPFSSRGLGLPSGHTAVAFGAAFILCRLFPRATPVWLTLAAGCGAMRLVKGVHFASDVYAAMIVAALITSLVWAVHLRLERRRALHAPDAA